MTSTQQPVTSTPLTQDEQIDQLGRYKYGWADADVAGASARRGINEDVVADISRRKSEPEWMLERRLKALKLFGRKPMPDWGSDLSGIDFQNIKYFVRSTEAQAASWEELPDDIKNTYDKLGIPEAEKQRLVSGVAAQYESEVVYHQIQKELEDQGVIFLDTDTALQGAPGPLPRVLRLGDPVRRQQVRRAEHRRLVGWLVHLRAEGRARRDPAAGLLPDQHREHGPVRADADHRRRGRLRALRRGLHRADLQVATRCTPRSSRSSSRRTRAAGTRPSRTGRTTSTTWSPSGRSPTRARPWSGSTATSAPR